MVALLNDSNSNLKGSNLQNIAFVEDMKILKRAKISVPTEDSKETTTFLECSESKYP